MELDGKKVIFQAYALKDPSTGYETNYVKLRDVALALSGTSAQFEVGWDGAVNLVAGKGYTANGTENKTPFSGDRAYTSFTGETRVNGKKSDLSAITLTDDKGGGYTYYKLRDLGDKLGFGVDWTAERGIIVTTGSTAADNLSQADEWTRAKALGFAASDAKKTASVTYAQFMTMLDKAVQKIDADKLAAWKARFPEARQSQDVIDRGNAALAIFAAAETLGGEVYARNAEDIGEGYFPEE